MELHHADKAYRRRCMAMLWLFATICAMALWWLHDWLGTVVAGFGDLPSHQQLAWLRWLIGGFGIAFALPLATLGETLRRFARAARHEQRYPPSQWRTLRTVRVLTGAVALAWAARVARAASWAFTAAIAFAGLAAWAWWRFQGS